MLVMGTDGLPGCSSTAASGFWQRRGLAELDWHRILDALVLVLRQR